MKVIFICITLITTFSLNAQTHLYTVVAGDTMVMNVYGCSQGFLQWQESSDSIIWTDVTGATDNEITWITTSVPLHKKFYRAICTDSVCPTAPPAVSSIIRLYIYDSLAQIVPGDFFRNGVVITVDSSGSGMISATSDQSTGEEWGCYRLNFPGAASLTDGEQNTSDIVSGCATRPIAASLCDQINGDWYLPAKDELDTLFHHKNLAGNFQNAYYWSSSSYDSSYAWMQQFATGHQTIWMKNSNYSVRCVRRFSQLDSIASKIFAYSQFTGYQPPVPVSIIQHPVSQGKCKSSSATFTVTAGGDPSITYQWKKNDVDIPGATLPYKTFTNLTLADEGLYSCEVSNYCGSTVSNYANLWVVQFSVSAGIDKVACMDQEIQLQAATMTNYPVFSGTISYEWLPYEGLNNANIESPVATPDTAECYRVKVTDSMGCTARDTVCLSYQYPYQDDEICIVYMDTSNNHITIHWSPAPDMGTEKFLIFRDVVGHVYEQIGEINYDTEVNYVDTSSDSGLRSYSYRITAVDTCGNQSQKSMSHKSIFLSVTEASVGEMELLWNHYEIGDSIVNPVEYNIYKWSNPGDIHLLATIPGNQNTFTDINVYTQQYYRIVAISDCNNIPLHSNICGNGFEGITSSQFSGKILITPNPMYSYAILEIPDLNSESSFSSSYSEYEIRILDLTGKVVRVEKPLSILRGSFDGLRTGSQDDKGLQDNSVMIERGNLKPGIYFVELNAGRTYRGKMIAE